MFNTTKKEPPIYFAILKALRRVSGWFVAGANEESKYCYISKSLLFNGKEIGEAQGLKMAEDAFVDTFDAHPFALRCGVFIEH